jgi:hypothetical protein
MDFDSYARRLWAGRADAYEHGFARVTVHAVGALLGAAGVGTDTRVLDVGTCFRTCRCPPPASTR